MKLSASIKRVLFIFCLAVGIGFLYGKPLVAQAGDPFYEKQIGVFPKLSQEYDDRREAARQVNEEIARFKEEQEAVEKDMDDVMAQIKMYEKEKNFAWGSYVMKKHSISSLVKDMQMKKRIWAQNKKDKKIYQDYLDARNTLKATREQIRSHEAMFRDASWKLSSFQLSKSGLLHRYGKLKEKIAELEKKRDQLLAPFLLQQSDLEHPRLP